MDTALWNTLLDLILLLSVAMVLGVIAQRLRQSAVVGYMLAGVVIGNIPGVVDNSETSHQLAQLGVTLLMFTIGLEFNWSRLRRMGTTAILSGTMQIALTMALAIGLGMIFMMPWRAAVAIAAAVSLSSTAVVLPVLQKRGQADSVHGRFALGILLVQDVAVVPLVLIVGALATPEGEEAASILSIFGDTIVGFAIVGAFIGVFYLFSRYALPHLVRVAAPARNREILTLFAFLMAMTSAWAATKVGISPALGAFLAAIFLGESVIATQIRGDVAAMKTVFVVLFFSSIGMYIKLPELAGILPGVIIMTALIVVFKPVVVFTVGLVMKLTPRSAAAAGCCMAQVGLFSFVIAQIANDGGILTDKVFSLIVATTILTLFLTPYAVAAGMPIGAHADRFMRKRGWTHARIGQDQAATSMAGGHVVVVGYGPAGREVVAAAREAGLPLIVLELNPESVIEARRLGLEAYVGDATQPDILRLARLETASVMVITQPDHRLTTAIIVEAKAQCADLKIIARARYHRYFGLLQGAGATTVVDEETHVGRRMSSFLAAAQLTSVSAQDMGPEKVPSDLFAD